MGERVGLRLRNWFGLGLAAGGELEKGFRGLGWKMVRQSEEAVLGRGADIGKPFSGNTPGKQVGVAAPLKQRRQASFLFYILRNDDLLDSLANLDDLSGTGLRMDFEFASFSPGVGLVVVIDVAEHQTLICAMDDDPKVAGNPD